MNPESSFPEQIGAIGKILELKLSAFANFHTATELLIKFLDDKDIDQIENILKERQACINTINKLNVHIMEAKKKLAIHYPSSSEIIASEFKALTDKVLDIINRSIYINNKCTMVAENHISTLRRESLTGIFHRQDIRTRQNQNSIESRFLNFNL